MSLSASGVCPAGRMPDQVLIDHLVQSSSVPSRRMLAHGCAA
jgi:hypothetical protein